MESERVGSAKIRQSHLTIVIVTPLTTEYSSRHALLGAEPLYSLLELVTVYVMGWTESWLDDIVNWFNFGPLWSHSRFTFCARHSMSHGYFAYLTTCECVLTRSAHLYMPVTVMPSVILSFEEEKTWHQILGHERH